MAGTSSPEAVKKLLENMQGDLRGLSLECRKKFPPVKEAAESGIIKVKTIAARNTDILAALKENSSEVVQPFLMGCGTKEPKITQLCLAAIQRLMSHEVVSEAIVLCFRLHFTKDNITNNTAAATVRQVVTVVFERVVAEDERCRDTIDHPVVVQGNSNRRSVSTLKPCAKDAYMLFQDLCQLVNADAPYWLVGMTEMTRTFGLELLESVLNDFPQVFLQVTECEIFLSLLVKFLDADKPQWLRAVAVESIHRLCVQPQLLRSFCQSYDMKQHSTKVFRDIVNALGSFIQSLFLVPSPGNASATPNQTGSNASGSAGSAQTNPGALGMGGGATVLPAFEYRGTWIPILNVTVQGSAKATYLEMLDKVEPPTIPEGYAMSVAFHCLLDLVRGITTMIEGELGQAETVTQTTTETTSLPAQSSEQQDLQSVSDQSEKELAYSIQGQNVQMISPSSESHQQVVAVGQPLALQPQGTVMHLVWILGLKPSVGGALKPGRAVEGPSTVLTTAVMTDLPSISSMISKLFENSQYLDDVSLHHLINALCSLSLEAMDMAYGNNKVCQHPNSRMREWGAEALTSLIKAGLTFRHDPPLSQNQRLQLLLLNPLKELSNISHPDIRIKQLECVLQILQSQGDSLGPGWPLVLGVMGAIQSDQGESLIRTAFQCLQLVVTDFLPTMPCTCLQIVVEVAGSFGLHNQELNISLTSIGLLWNISDYFFQRGEIIEKELNKEEAVLQKQAEEKGVMLNRPFHPASPFDCLWLCLYAKLGELCVDPRPAVRKSAGQTLFSTIGAHGTLLQHSTWHTVIWKVLFHLLDRVRESSTTADKEKIESGGGNILIHHSRDTAEKQWAETWVLTLAGVARIFNTRRYLLQPLGDFSQAWDVLLDHIQSAALSKNNEVSLAALKSFQEILQIVSPVRDSEKPETPPAINVSVPLVVGTTTATSLGRSFMRTDSIGERIGRYNGSELPVITDEIEDLNLWWAAWNSWYRIGSESTRPPITCDKLTFIPSQPFLTALIQIFPALYQHIKTGFSMDDLQKLGVILHGAVSVPISSDASPFILPSYTEAVLTSLQEAVLTALDVLQKAICVGSESMQIMYPAIFDQLLAFVEFSCKPPQYGQLETKHIANAKYNQAEWVALNYVPFAERSLEVVVDLYQKTACHKAVVTEKVLQNIIKTLRIPLSLKYSCPSESTWKLAVSSLLKVLSIGLPVARQHASSGKFDSMWPELANTFEDFLFTKSTPPDNLSIQEFQKNESIDVEVVQLISTEILPYANFIPKEFVGQIMTMLNKGSIHSQSSSFTEAEIDIRMREEFSKVCFETLLQFSFSNKVTTPQEGYISRMALSVLLKRSQDVLHRYIEDERLSGKCPLPRQQVTEIIFVLKAVSTLIDSLKKTQPENVDASTWAQVIALYPTLVECITCSSSEVCSALKEALVPFKDFMQPPASKLFTSNFQLAIHFLYELTFSTTFSLSPPKGEFLHHALRGEVGPVDELPEESFCKIKINLKIMNPELCQEEDEAKEVTSFVKVTPCSATGWVKTGCLAEKDLSVVDSP
ncbi:Protein MON2 like protein [Willisornis vidua]|uniref:Protein MON2 homolog n=1 Tax=Willisornis vidua TaxID=1566151 RepID=A0ABQ9DP59_9PASS|nr:Protein MON2 like protein [Willisornis vidua]